jgi:hypothetical protein
MIGGADPIMSSVWIFNIILGVIVCVCLFFVAKNANKIAAEQKVEEIEDGTAIEA